MEEVIESQSLNPYTVVETSALTRSCKRPGVSAARSKSARYTVDFAFNCVRMENVFPEVNTKFIFVTGGCDSSLAKASPPPPRRILETLGTKITM